MSRAGGEGSSGVDGSERRRLPAIISLALLIAACSTVSRALAGESSCGPFGDPPAEVQQGWFATFVSDHNPICFGATVLGPWRDSSGAERYACLYEPKSAAKESPLPLVVFLHGSLVGADSILVTGLASQAESRDLGGATPGFILLAPEGRYTNHYYPAVDAKGLGWDNWYRQLNPSGDVTISGVGYEENADAAAIDHFVQEEISTGKADRNRIYLMGWSNGAAMALLYALNRPQVAAAAVYSAPNPFSAFVDACPQRPVDRPPNGNAEVQVFNPRLTALHVRNACDVGGICPNGDALAKELGGFKGDFEDVILDSSGDQVSRCEDSCGTDPMAGGSVSIWNGLRGLKNHTFWPKRWTSPMLDFLKLHPLGANSRSVNGR